MVMLGDEAYVVNHFKETKDFVKAIPSQDIANWILSQGYFAEQYILPPSFQVSNFTLQAEPYKKNLSQNALLKTNRRSKKS